MGAINPAGDVDYYRIDGVPAGSLLFTFTDTGDGPTNITGNTNQRDTEIDVYAADGTTLIENDDDDGGGNGGDNISETGLASAVAGRVLTAGGTYYIKVYAFSTSYIINQHTLYVRLLAPTPTVEVESNDTAATATALALNTLGTGTLSPIPSDVDFWAVTLTAGNVAEFYLDGDPERNAGTTANVDHQLALIAPNQTTLLFDVNHGTTVSSATDPEAEAFDYAIPTSGTYYVRVMTTSTTGSGTYQLTVSQSSACGPTPTPTATATPTGTATATATASPTPTATATATLPPTPTPTATPSPTPPVCQTFTNLTPIAIPDSTAPPTLATPYSSDITVSGAGTVITNVSVTLNGVSHSFPDDIDILLVGPTGLASVIMSDVGGSVSYSPVARDPHARRLCCHWPARRWSVGHRHVQAE